MARGALLIPVVGLGLAAFAFVSLSKAETSDACAQVDPRLVPKGVSKRLQKQYCEDSVMLRKFLPASGGTPGGISNDQLEFVLGTSQELEDSGVHTSAQELLIMTWVAAGGGTTPVDFEDLRKTLNVQSIPQQVQTIRQMVANIR